MKFFSIVVFITFIFCRSTEAAQIHQKKNCDMHCNSKVYFVCGSNNLNYINDCALKQAICENTTEEFRKAYDGICSDVFGRLRGLVFDPVCVNDGRTYSNVVFMDLAARNSMHHKRVITNGPCSCGKNRDLDIPKCDIGCEKVYNPVCGDDGETYANECVLDKQNCILGGKAIRKLHNGVCKVVYTRVGGIENFSPVCASDGNTYSSEAFVNVARYQDAHLKIVKDEACH